MAKRIFRYEVPVDDRWHEFDLHGDPLAVVCRRASDLVEFWAYAYTDEESAGGARRQFMIVGTGQGLPEPGMRHWGIGTYGPFVWHLMERAQGNAGEREGGSGE